MGFPKSPGKHMNMLSISKARLNEKGDAMLDPYSSWLIRHPSALEEFERMMSTAMEKEIVVFLDYDGTLSPIVDDPHQAFMSEQMREAVSKVAHCFPTAIISGRCRDTVHDFVQLNNVYYAGSHGMDILAPLPSSKFGNSKYQTKFVDETGTEVAYFQPALDFLPAIEKILEMLEEKTREIEGAVTENNRFCVSVHYRHVHPDDVNSLENLVERVMEVFPEFCIQRGKKVLEIRPSISWNKGFALEYLLDTLGFKKSSDVLPLYIGDDQTDEDAFKVIKHNGQGFPIVVSSIPKETCASYSLRDPTDVLSFLENLADWKKKCSSK